MGDVVLTQKAHPLLGCAGVGFEAGGERIEALFLPRTDPLPDEPSVSLGNYLRTQGLEATIAAIVYPDRRGDGYGTGRYEDHPRLDFSRVEREHDVHFAHKSGFMCKTAAMEPERLRALILEAWIEESPATGQR